MPQDATTTRKAESPAAVASAWKIIPTFESDDMAATLAFYVDTLGFELASTKPEDGDPSLFFFCSIWAGEKAAANIYFFKPGGRPAKPSSAYIALGTTQLDELHDSLKARGDVEFADEIQDQPWGFRQFAVKDPHGNTLTFFKYLEGGNPRDE